MLILGIESTCDETACAIVRDGREILSNIVASQTDLHETMGGVMPELACRRHADALLPVLEQALSEAKVSLSNIDGIAVANRPGLVGALLIGITAAKALALALKKPLVGVNHIEAHLYAALMAQESDPTFPCLGVVLSGGHTAILKMESLGSYTLIGQTVDDAVGEAFDKAARILGLPYPGGPEIERLALTGDATRFKFKAGTVKRNPHAFSFSGLKTALLYAARDLQLNVELKADLAAAFQEAALSDIVLKLKLAIKQTGAKTLVFGGGVTNNQALRLRCSQEFNELNLLWPHPSLTLDNAAMIAGLGYHKFLQGQCDTIATLEAIPTGALASISQ